MQTEPNIRLTAAELSKLWAAYQNDTLAKSVLQYYVAIVEDNDIKAIVQHGLELAQSHIERLLSCLTMQIILYRLDLLIMM
jgi:hypothetical protein